MSSELDTCGCDAENTDTEVSNAPGQSELAWRVGTWASFYRRMKAAIPSTAVTDAEDETQEIKPLAPSVPEYPGLATRAADDPALALMDAAACVLDVLTFYQERIANEGFIRTATEDRSVQELARAIGYERAPGVAASVHLAFTVQDAAGAPGESTVYAGTQVLSVPGQDETPQTFEVSEELYCHKDWNTIPLATTTPHTLAGATAWAEATEANKTLVLEGINLRIRAGDRIALVGAYDAATTTYVSFSTRLVAVYEDIEQGLTALTLLEPISPDVMAGEDLASEITLHVFRSMMSAFGYNAPTVWFNPLAGTGTPPPGAWQAVDTDVRVFNGTTDYVQLSGENQLIVGGTLAFLEGQDYFDYSFSSKLYKVLDAQLSQSTDFTMSGRTTAMKVAEIGGGGSPTYREVRTFRAWVQSEELTLAAIPITGPLATTSTDFSLALDEEIEIPPDGRTLLVVDKDGYELVTVDAAASTSTSLVLTAPLSRAYDRDSVKIYGNVVEATHGESVSETLGNGDGTVPNPSFTLAAAPVTHVASDAPSGADSTAVITVGGVPWTRVSSFYGAAPTDEVYTERLDEDGYTEITFGDGVAGARLPTGTSNVTAAYRKGIGTPANVDAAKLTLLRSRPLGISGVTNPVAAGGGAEADAFADLRTNAPLSVVTLDRLVSLGDYEAYASAYPGVGKARADLVRVGGKPTVLISALDAVGDPLGDTTAENLRRSIALYKDPGARVQVSAGSILYFRVSVKVRAVAGAGIDKAAISAALAAEFTWEERAFVQNVYASEVLAVIQAMDGVLGAQVLGLECFAVDGGHILIERDADRLLSYPASAGTTSGVAARLLVYYGDPTVDSYQITEVTP